MSQGEPFWRRYLRFFGADPNADIDDELEFHLDALVAEYRARGLTESEAREAARVRFGNVTGVRRELRKRGAGQARRARWGESWHGWWQDVRLTGRRLRNQPGFTLAVAGVLALGVGATTVMFSAVDAALLRPLPFVHAERLVTLPRVGVPIQIGPRHSGPRYADLTDMAPMTDVFRDVATYASGTLNLGDPVNPRRLRVGVVTNEFFQTLGVQPLLGRMFSREESEPKGPDVVVLSYGLWQARFGGRSVIGKTIPLAGRSFTIIGIMPPPFAFPEASEAWIPLTVPASLTTFQPFRGILPTTTVARLAPGVTLATADARVLARWQQVLTETEGNDPRAARAVEDRLTELRNHPEVVRPLQAALVGTRRTALVVLLAATGALLLIVCANVTNLLLSRAAGRRREWATRAVLGARRARLVRESLLESLLLAAVGTALGIAMAPVGLRFVSALLPQAFEGLAAPTLDWRVLGFAVGLAMVTSLAFGSWPALAAARSDPAIAIKAGAGWGATQANAGRGRQVLVGAELALTVLLLVGAGLMLKSFMRLVGTPTGLEPEHVASLEMTLAGRDLPTRLRIVKTALSSLERMPGITSAGAVNDLPLSGDYGFSLTLRAADQPPPTNDTQVHYAHYLFASGDYFRTLGIPLLRGRTFTRSDDRAASGLASKAVMLSASAARALWGDDDAVGRRIALPGPTGDDFATVIGVVGDVRDFDLQDSSMQMYFSAYASMTSNVALVVRGSAPPAVLLRDLREAVHRAEPTQAVYKLRMLDDVIGASLSNRRTRTLLITGFGAVALLLSALGVWAVVAYTVARRMPEFGIRVALGATGRDLVRKAVGEMAWVVAAGLLVGLAAAWVAARVIRSLLYEVSVRDPLVFVVAPAVLLIPVLIATLLPARRAARSDPMAVIRVE